MSLLRASASTIEVFLHPGEYFAGDGRHRICTLLGSCVSVTLWHPRKRVGAMSHFLLAERNGATPAGRLDARYARDAILLMLLDLKRMGVPVGECQAKLFGGGDMFPGQKLSASVGRSNGEMARRLVRAHHIPIVSESLFGEGHRKIIFDVSTGDVWARRSVHHPVAGRKSDRQAPALAGRVPRRLP